MNEQAVVNRILSGFDDDVGMFATVNGACKYIHDGKGFFITGNPRESSAYYIGFHTPSDKHIHLRPMAFSSSAVNAQLYLYEDESFSSGSSVTPINANRQSTNTSDVTVSVDCTASPSSDFISAYQAGSGGIAFSTDIGALGGDANARLLKLDTDYVLKFLPSGDTVMIYEMFWFEKEVE